MTVQSAEPNILQPDYNSSPHGVKNSQVKVQYVISLSLQEVMFQISRHGSEMANVIENTICDDHVTLVFFPGSF